MKKQLINLTVNEKETLIMKDFIKDIKAKNIGTALNIEDRYFNHQKSNLLNKLNNLRLGRPGFKSFPVAIDASVDKAGEDSFYQQPVKAATELRKLSKFFKNSGFIVKLEKDKRSSGYQTITLKICGVK